MPKKLFLSLVFFIVGFGLIAASPDSLKTKHQIGLIIKADLLALGYDAITYKKTVYQKYYAFSVEKLLGKQHSLQLSYCNAPTAKLDGKNKWYVISSEYKFFVSKNKPHTGYYIGGSLKYIHYYEKSSRIPPQTLNDPAVYTGIYESHSLGVGFVNGVQFYLLKRITIDVMAGLGVFSEIAKKEYNSYFLESGHHYYGFGISNHLDYKLAINLGFKF